MIIKEKEWNELNEEVSNNQKDRLSLIESHKKEIESLNLKIKELEKSKKSDEIIIDIYGQVNDRGYWVKYREVQFTKSTITLSSGVKGQVLRIFRNVLRQLNDHFDTEIEFNREECYEVSKKYNLNKDKVLKLPYFTTRKRVLKELFTV